MPERNASSRSAVAAAYVDHPVLSDFAARWPQLGGTGKRDASGAFDEIAKRLGKSKRAALIRITLHSGDALESWSLAMKSGRCKVSRDDGGKADLELITTPETWAGITSGRLSLLEAFGAGSIRVRGDLELARVLARRVREA